MGLKSVAAKIDHHIQVQGNRAQAYGAYFGIPGAVMGAAVLALAFAASHLKILKNLGWGWAEYVFAALGLVVALALLSVPIFLAMGFWRRSRHPPSPTMTFSNTATLPAPLPATSMTPASRVARKKTPQELAMDQWSKAASYELWQAACLWVGEVPAVNHLVPRSPSAEAALGRLIAAATGGILSFHNVEPSVGSVLLNMLPLASATSRAHRNDLVAYAQKEGDRPAFLNIPPSSSRSPVRPVKSDEDARKEVADLIDSPYIQARPGEKTARPQLDIGRVVVELRGPENHRKEVVVLAQIRNRTHSDLSACSVTVESVECDDQTIPIGRQVRVGPERAGTFPLTKEGFGDVAFLWRRVNTAPEMPFTLCLQQDYSLEESKNYLINLSLDAGTGVVTRAVMRADLGEYENLKVNLLDQASWRQPPKDTE